MTDAPAPPPASPRVREIVAAARELLDANGWEAISMRTVADRLGIRAPSLYKHVGGKGELHAALVADGLREMGAALYASLDPGAASGPDTTEAAGRAGRAGHRGSKTNPPGDRVADLLHAYRAHALANGPMYRLATSGPLDRAALPAGLEEWAGHPFFAVTGDAVRAQALWAAAHGLTILELDGRFPPGSPLDEVWAATARAWAP